MPMMPPGLSAPAPQCGRRLAHLFLALLRINTLGKVNRSGKIAHLRHGKRHLLDRISARIVLLDRDHLGESIYDDILAQRRIPFVNKGDHSRVKFMLDTKHSHQTRGIVTYCKGPAAVVLLEQPTRLTGDRPCAA